MVPSPDVSIANLSPESFRLHLQFKVVELLISLEAKHETSDALITVNEYLVADESGCIILNTKSDLKIDSIYEITDGHTQIIEGYLTLYSNNVEPSSKAINTTNTQNNRSLVKLERKI